MEEEYDEFGNYIGPDPDDENQDEEGVQSFLRHHEDDDVESQIKQARREMNKQDVSQGVLKSSKQGDTLEEQFYAKGQEIVLHEDKQYYKEAEEVFGKGVEALVEEEDHQPITQPIIESPKKNFTAITAKDVPKTTYSNEYLVQVMGKPQLLRNVAIIGALHHGKTLLSDMLIEATLEEKQKASNNFKPKKFTDSRVDELDRLISMKAAPFQILLQDSREKNYAFNFIDTPGHPDFSDEVSAALRLADNVILVVDVLEGVTAYSTLLIQQAMKFNKPIVVCLNKMDRLVLEVRLPPRDAYHKIKQVIHDINVVIQKYRVFQFSGTHSQELISPHKNLVFASTLYGAIFSLSSFAQMYKSRQVQIEGLKAQAKLKHSAAVKQGERLLDTSMFEKCLWGDVFYMPEKRQFSKKSGLAQGLDTPRSFVHYILEPFYKIISLTLTQDRVEMMRILKLELGGIHSLFKKQEFELDINPLLRLVLSRTFGRSVPTMVDAMVKNFQTAKQAMPGYVSQNFSSDSDASQELQQKIEECDPKGPLSINIVKMFYDERAGRFNAMGRIVSGTIQQGQRVSVLGEKFTPEEQDDFFIAKATQLFLVQQGGRYKIEVDQLCAGNWVLISDIDTAIVKTATVWGTDEVAAESLAIFKPLDLNTKSVIRVACEPLNPSDLPKVQQGLKHISKSYPASQIKVEESGEHTILGTGELYLDSLFKDLRTVFTNNVEVKLSEPFVSIAETVADTSSVNCMCETPNKKNQLSMVAQPLDKGLGKQIEFLAGNFEGLQGMLTERFGWDELESSSVWALGPTSTSTNMLIDYTLGFETDTQKLKSVKNSLIQGFQWATREGPLCEEPINNVKFKLTSAQIADEPVYRGGGQVIPTCRRAAYSSFLLANPRILEPINEGEVMCPKDCVEVIVNVLMRRRGHVVSEEPIGGSPFYQLKIEIPVMESFGLETDIRTATMGQAMILTWFDHWTIAPGDPLNKDITLLPLEPAEVPHIARELMVKTRRRKGLLDDVSVVKFFDSRQMIEVAKRDMSLMSYF